MTKTARRPSKRKGGGEEDGGVGATPKEMARAKHMITNNKEERKKQRARYIFTTQNVSRRKHSPCRMAEKLKYSVILDVGGDRFLALNSTLLR